MARTLKFGTDQLGTQIVKIVPATAPQTPPVIGVGVFFDSGLVASQQRNLIYRVTVFVAYKAADELIFAANSDLLQRLLGLQKNVGIYDGGTLKAQGVNWFFEDAPPPDTLPGFGGRFIAEWPLTFVGQAPLVWY